MLHSPYDSEFQNSVNILTAMWCLQWSKADSYTPATAVVCRCHDVKYVLFFDLQGIDAHAD